jgi:transposase
MLTRDEILAVYAAGPEAVVALVEQLQGQLLALTERVAALEARLAKDSHNSHQPPASDGLARKTRSLRQKSGKKSGGQPGHPGSTLRWSEHPERIVTHAPDGCAQCGTPLAEAAERGSERRQVVDLPPLRLEVTEHRALQRVCPHCQATTQATFPPFVTQSVQYGPGIKALAVYLNQYQLLPWERASELLTDLFGHAPGEGSLATFLSTCFTRLEPIEAAIREAIRAAPVAQMDETGVRIAGKTRWLHYVGTATRALYTWHPKRGREAIEAVGVLPEFAGTRVHDAWAPYLSYGGAYALCNAHLLRELTFVAEQPQQRWASELIGALLAMKAAVEQAQAAGATALPEAERQAFAARYAALVSAGLAQNPAPATTGKRGRPKQSPAKNLLDRLDTHQGAVLAFLHDFAIPFDNNLAERDLRMVKVQQKISGGFRTPRGASQFCRIRGFIVTLRKQGSQVLTALQSVFADAPCLPALSG